MTSELVSIIMPMYKGADFVGKTIESVIHQTFTNWELIIVDDCSADDNAGINVVNSYHDRRINLIVNSVNLGSSGSRNVALRSAKGRFISFLDSDDLWHPEYLEKQLRFLEQSGATIVFSSFKRIDEATDKEVLIPYIVPKRVDYRSLLRTCPLIPSASVYDRSRCRSYLFNERMGSLRDDYVYWLEMLKDIDYAFGNQEVLVSYRLRRSSVTSNKLRMIIPQWSVLRRVERLSLLSCVYNIASWAVISFFKYLR